jgi:hypothetical protein
MSVKNIAVFVGVKGCFWFDTKRTGDMLERDFRQVEVVERLNFNQSCLATPTLSEVHISRSKGEGPGEKGITTTKEYRLLAGGQRNFNLTNPTRYCNLFGCCVA